MMGRREEGQGQFFYSFDLDKVVPPDHLVRQIDGLLDLSWVHRELAPYYSHTGRPSIDPVLMIRMLIVGYVFALRSERRLCAEVQVNLAYRWFCKLGIEDRIPDHSVFCRARHERFRESDALRRVFEAVVAMCIATGLVGGEAFSIDASLIKADVDKKKRMPGDQPIAWPKAEEASHAVREYLAALDTARGDEDGGGDAGGSGKGGDRHLDRGSRLHGGVVFRPVNRGDQAQETALNEKVVWQLLQRYTAAAGVPGIAPHDLRRTCAKLCRASGGELEQIQLLLGHASVQTTERYLGTKQDLVHAPNDGSS